MVGLTTLVVALVAIVLWTFHGALLRSLASKWVVSSPLERADAIVVLGGGLALRPAAAIELYNEGYAPLILVARASADRGGEAIFARNILLRGGIPSLDYVKSHGAKSLIIPTEIFSTRRVGWIFERKFAPASVKVFIKPTTPTNYGIDDWWLSRAGSKDFLREIAKSLYYCLMY
jgi:hypothetical protein